MHGHYMHAAGCKGKFSLNFPWLESIINYFESVILASLLSEVLFPFSPRVNFPAVDAFAHANLTFRF